MKKTALVTGASRGIGLAIARSLAKENHNIAMLGMRASAEVAEAIQELEALGASVLYCRADVSDAAARTQALADIKETFGALHLLVNNAGMAPAVRADILEMSEESYERVMKVNLQGPFFLTQAVANGMIEEKQADASFTGCIINVSSISATVASPSRGEYCLSKAGVGMATQLFAVRLGEYEIPVYELRPGIIKTDMTKVVTEKYDRLIAEEGILLQSRWGVPEDIGKAAAMLARGDLAYSTGQVITLDGGYTVQRL